jgi:hypothetical protein
MSKVVEWSARTFDGDCQLLLSAMEEIELEEVLKRWRKFADLPLGHELKLRVWMANHVPRT